MIQMILRNPVSFIQPKGSETIHLKNFRESFSFFHDGPVNINTASPYLVKFLCGDDDSLYDEVIAGPSSSSGDPYFKSMNDPNLAQLRSNRSISTSTTASVFRAVLVTVTKGKANFQLHAILASGNSCSAQIAG